MKKHPSTRGEIWQGRVPNMKNAEAQSVQLVVVVSSPALDTTSMRIIVPLVEWKPEFAGRMDKVKIKETTQNGLDATFVAEFLNVRNVPTEFFLKRIGALDAEQVEEIVAGVVIAIDYWPQKSSVARVTTAAD